MNIRKLIKNRVVKNAGWIISGRIAQVLINFILSLFTLRYLGPDNYGLINYAAAYTGILSSVSSLGINAIIVKEFVDKPGQEGVILGTSLGLRLVASALSTVAILCVSFIWDANEPETHLVVTLYSVGAILNSFEVFTYWFQSQLQSKKTSIATLCAYTVMAGYKIILLMLDMPVSYFAIASAIDYAVIAVILVGYYVRDKGARLSFSWRYGSQLLKSSHHYILTGLMVSIYAQTDKLMLKQMVNESETGFYSVAYSLSGIWCFVLAAIISSLNPIIMEAHKGDRLKYGRLNRLLYNIVIYLSFFVAGIYMMTGEWIVVFLYGEAYRPAAIPLKILAWQTAFSYLGVARDTWIVCENKQKYLKYIYISAMLANVSLNAVWIPVYGVAGAAFASLVTQVITTFIVPFFIVELKENVHMMLDALLFRGLKTREKQAG